jgi:hypothetical protein
MMHTRIKCKKNCQKSEFNEWIIDGQKCPSKVFLRKEKNCFTSFGANKKDKLFEIVWKVKKGFLRRIWLSSLEKFPCSLSFFLTTHPNMWAIYLWNKKWFSFESWKFWPHNSFLLFDFLQLYFIHQQ